MRRADHRADEGDQARRGAGHRAMRSVCRSSRRTSRISRPSTARTSNVRSASRWSAAFLDAAGPLLERCVATSGATRSAGTDPE